jgi:hypothetical protein
MNMKDEKVTSPTGIFAVEGKRLVPINETAPATSTHPANSMNAYVEMMGHREDNVHWAFTYASDKIQAICFRGPARIPILVVAKSEAQPLSYQDIARDIDSIDWAMEMLLA